MWRFCWSVHINNHICICARKNQQQTLFKMERFDYVVNFAAESHVDHSIDNPSLFTHANVVGTQNLLNLCVQYQVEKFIHISTDVVYDVVDSYQSLLNIVTK